MLSSLQGQFGQVVMRVWRGGDDNYVDPRIPDQLLRASVRFDPGMVFLCVILGFRSSLDNRIQLELRNVLDKGDMEDFGAGTVADDAEIPCFGGHCGVTQVNFVRAIEQKLGLRKEAQVFIAVST